MACVSGRAKVGAHGVLWAAERLPSPIVHLGGDRGGGI
jgi:hypothetical protein